LTPADYTHISYEPGTLRLLDQTQLPQREEYVDCREWQDVAAAITRMQVRGAPAIGISGAYGVALAAHNAAARATSDDAFFEALRQAAQGLSAARPTAVNLSWAVTQALDVANRLRAGGASRDAIVRGLAELASRIHADDIAACRRIGNFGAALLPAGSRVLTHCNTGDLATGGYGTALGIIRSAWRDGKLEHAYAAETRPLLQGARLTAWELQRDQIPYTLITDGMAAHFMRQGSISAVIVGADRIARNGDVANKIGTYSLAVLARAHRLPFIVAAPLSTFDANAPTGAAIAIEQRSPAEVTGFGGVPTAAPGAAAANPAFDVTPAEYITAIVSDAGVARPPFESTLAELMEGCPRAAAAGGS
jgi:methylthioribose-1-phosphate isomerase